MIRVQAVRRAFGQTDALAGVSLHADRGEVLGLLGPNGAGKTTLVRVLATLVVPDAGRASVGGHDVVEEAAAVRSLIGLAGQLAAVDPLLSGRENLELVGRLYGLGRDERRRRAIEVLERFDLDDAADRLVATYSGGMRRRLDVAATLVGEPAVLLLDEPTTGLDPRSRSEVWRRVEDLAAAGTTVLLTSQHLEEVDRLADRIVVLDDGHVIASGTAAALKRRVGGDVVEARPGDIDAALAALDGLAAQVDRAVGRLTVPAVDGVATLVAVGRRLQDAGVALDDLALRRPSLDDVFFALTDAEAPVEPPAEAPPAAATETDPVPVVVRRSGTSDVTGITGRYLRQLARTPQLLFFGLLQPVLFVLFLAPVFGGVVESFTDGDYLQYLLPGIVVMTMALAAGTTGIGLAEDVQQGVIDRFRSLPMTRYGLLIGRTFADLARNVAATVLVVAACVALGYRFEQGLVRGVAAVGVALLFGYALMWLFAAVGLAVKDVQTAQFLGFAPVLPLVFVSGAWIPVDAMSSWLQGFARNQPVNVTIDAMRALLDGGDVTTLALRSVAWSVGIGIVSGWVAVRRYSATSA